MAITLETVRARVQAKINELDERKVSTGVVAIDNAIADAYLLLSARLPPPRLFTASAFTIGANSETFTLPAGEYRDDVELRLVSVRTFLKKSTRDEINAFRHGDSSTIGSGYPTHFSLFEELDQGVKGDCWPRSKNAEPCDLFSSLLPADLRSAASMDAASIFFSRFGTTALVLHTAARLLKQMTAEDAALRRLNPNVADDWINDAEMLLYQEEVRRHVAEDSGRTQRWVS